MRIAGIFLLGVMVCIVQAATVTDLQGTSHKMYTHSHQGTLLYDLALIYVRRSNGSHTNTQLVVGHIGGLNIPVCS